MGKRSDFERVERDYYPTPYKAVLPLLPHLPVGGCGFIEPCAGDGRLIEHLERAGHVCSESYDIEPQREGIGEADALMQIFLTNADCIITNPPWRRDILHPMIEWFRLQKPTWLLFDADWMHTKQSAEFMPYCRMIVSVGRVSWMENGTSGKDNCAWYLFGREVADTVFYGRSRGL